MPGETPPPEDPDEEFRKKQQAVFNLVTVGGIVIATRYGTLKKMVPTGYNANHLNQDAAYRDVIPYNEGLANPLQGNLIYRAQRTLNFMSRSTGFGGHTNRVAKNLVKPRPMPSTEKRLKRH